MQGRIGIAFIIILALGWLSASAQLSPGELTEFHAHLEGMSNCTQCHDLGEHVSEQKCLACHKELKIRIDQKKGFHASSKVLGKSCISCHSDHLSRKYDIVHLDKTKFDHQATGFVLEGKHKEKQCADCHKPENIKDQVIRKKKLTYLGLSTECLSCHKDYHQGTLPNNCINCHTFDSFKPTKKFDHQTTKFPLKGKHREVTCLKCHPMEKKNGQDFQKFTGVAFNNCNACHKDVHENKFGSDCRKCHSEESFHKVSELKGFDHSRTNFQLKGKHAAVDCKKCHKVNLTANLEYERCSNCHADFHKGQFTTKNPKSDCRDCHTENGYSESQFSIEQHNKSAFRLEGAHLATPCFACHKRNDEWKFAGLDKNCVSCHPNIHKNFMSEKYMPEERCDKCHTVNSWKNVMFDHKTTNFELLGKHAAIDCRSCHFKKTISNQPVQIFSELKTACESCHIDIHQRQFATNGTTDCIACHGFENWKAEKFNHNQTRFKLDGGHKNVDCYKCHRQNNSVPVPFIQFKNTDRQCKSCHI